MKSVFIKQVFDRGDPDEEIKEASLVWKQRQCRKCQRFFETIRDSVELCHFCYTKQGQN